MPTLSQTEGWWNCQLYSLHSHELVAYQLFSQRLTITETDTITIYGGDKHNSKHSADLDPLNNLNNSVMQI